MISKTSTKDLPQHFKGKDALAHVVEAQAEGIISSTEIHGAEIPGHVSAFADAARETSLALLLVWTLLISLELPVKTTFFLLTTLAAGWLIWKAGRSAWLAWSRLERLHRLVAEEQWEIEHHRQQERNELRELYAAKGFEGRLLEDVLDVLMADGDRLLRVMVEEELGLSLQSQEHPLKQSLGAALGAASAALANGIAFFLFPLLGIAIATCCVLGLAGALSAYYQKNKVIPAVVWNIALGAIAFSFVYFLLQLI